DFHRAGKDICGLAHGGAHAMALRGQVVDERTPDEARSAGDQDAHQGVFPRAKLTSRKPTRTAPVATATADMIALGRSTVSSASARRARLSRSTRATIPDTVKPPSVAR